MTWIKEIYPQLRRLTPILLKVYFPILILLASFVMMQIFYGIRVSTFTKDPIQVLGGEPWVGLLTNLGILVWAAAVSISCFTSYLLRNHANHKGTSKFLLISALFTLFLMLDDLFLLHERVFPQMLHIPEILVYLAYGIILIWYLFVFYKDILKGDYVLFLLAICFFGGSISFDFISEFIRIPGVYIFEDGLKFCGIVTWFLFFLRMGAKHLNGVLIKGTVQRLNN